MRRLLILSILLVLAGCGGTDTDFAQSTVPPAPLPQSLTTPVDQALGANLKLASHELSIPPQSLSQSTTVTLSITAQPGAQPRNPDFQAFGTHLVVDLGGASHQGLTAHLPPPDEVPANARVFPVQVVDDHFVPLRGTPQADGSMVVKLVVDASRFQVGDAQGILTPPHVNWGSYNGYYYDSQAGGFVELIHQGQLNGGESIPNLGPRPCMMVHGIGATMRKQQLAPMAKYLLEQGVVTGVVGFEYDTLDSIQNNGVYLAQFYAEMARANPNAQWRHLAHSTGCLVSREAIENNTLPIAGSGNIAVFLCGPHLGSDLLSVLLNVPEITSSTFVESWVVNDFLDFTNSDAKRCQVSLQDAGFVDWAIGSTALAALNLDPQHPQFVYNTLAGDHRDSTWDFLDSLATVKMDDGLVDVSSANYSGIGQAGSEVVAVSHTQAPTSATLVFPVVKQFFTP